VLSITNVKATHTISAALDGCFAEPILALAPAKSRSQQPLWPHKAHKSGTATLTGLTSVLITLER